MTTSRRIVGRARGAERRLDAQALLLVARLRLRKILASKAHAGSPRCYMDLRELAEELQTALREVNAAVAIVAALPRPVIEVDPPTGLARDLARNPDDRGPEPPRAA